MRETKNLCSSFLGISQVVARVGQEGEAVAQPAAERLGDDKAQC